MVKSAQILNQKNIEFEEHGDFWENFSITSTNILDILKNSFPDSDDFSLADPSKIKISDSLSVSVFLYGISENLEVKDQQLTDFPGKERCSFSEQILNYIITVQSKNHSLEMNAMEKILAIIFSNPDIAVSKTIQKAHLRINPAEKPFDIWRKLFSSIPYRPSILLTVHGSGVVYRNSDIKQGTDLNFYDSNRF